MSDIKRRLQSNPFDHIRHKTNDDWYLYWVYEDRDFQAELEAYNDFYSSKANRELSEVEKNQGEAMRAAMLHNYDLTVDEFDYIQTGMHTQYPLDFPYSIVKRHKNGDLVIRVPGNIKRVDYLEAWEDLEDFLRVSPLKSGENKKTRRRAADDTRLLYAISKARKRGLTFAQIFAEYQDGSLPAYENGPRNQLASEDYLELYYQLHEPKW